MILCLNEEDFNKTHKTIIINEEQLNEYQGLVTQNDSTEFDTMLKKTYDEIVAIVKDNGEIPDKFHLDVDWRFYNPLNYNAINNFLGVNVPKFEFIIQPKSFPYNGTTATKKDGTLAIHINSKRLENFEDFRSTFLHELTHVVQDYNGDKFGGDKMTDCVSKGKDVPLKVKLSKFEISARINAAYHYVLRQIENNKITTNEEIWKAVFDRTQLDAITEKMQDPQNHSLYKHFNDFQNKCNKLYYILVQKLYEKNIPNGATT